MVRVQTFFFGPDTSRSLFALGGFSKVLEKDIIMVERKYFTLLLSFTIFNIILKTLSCNIVKFMLHYLLHTMRLCCPPTEYTTAISTIISSLLRCLYHVVIQEGKRRTEEPQYFMPTIIYSQCKVRRNSPCSH